jgi:CelD/BcsL family acetyltransferase involved in cellulose biosynthesis
LIGADPTLWSPFVTPTFSRIVGEHRPRSRIALLADGPEVVGFLPYEANAEQVGLPLGGGLSDVQTLIADPELLCDLPGVVRRLGVREWRFDHLLPGRPATRAYEASLHPSPTVDLARGVDAYHDELKARSANLLAQRARRARQIERSLGPLRFEWDDHDPALLDLLMQWKSLQYQRTSARDLFAEPWARAALHAFHELDDDPECTGHLATLRAGDHVVAMHFGIARGPVLHYWFPVYDTEFSKYSPGNVLLHEMITAAPARGITLVDLGRGDQEYKRRVANGGYVVAEGRVPARGRAYRAVLLARHPGWLVRRAQALRARRREG